MDSKFDLEILLKFVLRLLLTAASIEAACKFVYVTTRSFGLPFVMVDFVH
jgi:hypothetical protein